MTESFPSLMRLGKMQRRKKSCQPAGISGMTSTFGDLMKAKLICVSSIAIALILLGGCDKPEPIRDIAYFEGLGFEKTLDYVKLCRDEKVRLQEKKDAEGLDRFAKSARATNCRTGFKYATGIEAEIINKKAATLHEATSHEALKTLQAQISRDVDSRWGDIPEVFKEWAKHDGAAMSYAFWNLSRIASSRSARLHISSMGR